MSSETKRQYNTEQNNLDKVIKDLKDGIKKNETGITEKTKIKKEKETQLYEIQEKKKKEIEQKKTDKNLQSQNGFISALRKQLSEYSTLVDYLNKIITSIGIIKKSLNELIFSKLNSQMKTNFKFIQKRYIKCLIDFYNFKIISNYIIKLNEIEKLKPQERQDAKFKVNINARYDKLKEEYIITFYKELEEILRLNDYIQITESVITFFNKLIDILYKDDDIRDDTFDDYQIYLIINLSIILANYGRKEEIKKLVNIFFKLIRDKDDHSADRSLIDSIDLIIKKGGYSDNISYDIKQNNKILKTDIKELSIFLKEKIYDSFILIRPVKDGQIKKKLNILISDFNITEYLSPESTNSNPNYILLKQLFEFIISNPNQLSSYINEKLIIKFFEFINGLKLDTKYIDHENIIFGYYIFKTDGINNILIFYKNPDPDFKEIFDNNISELTIDETIYKFLTRNDSLKNHTGDFTDKYYTISILYHIILKSINDLSSKIDNSFKKDLLYLIYFNIFLYNCYINYIKTTYIDNNDNFKPIFDIYNDIIKQIKKTLTELCVSYNSTSDIYRILQYLIQISHYMYEDIREYIDKKQTILITNTTVNNLGDVDKYINSNAIQDFSVILYIFNKTRIDDIINEYIIIKEYIINIHDILSDITAIHTHFYAFHGDTELMTYIKKYTIVTNEKILNYLDSLFTDIQNDIYQNCIKYLIIICKLINYDKSIKDSLKKESLNVLYFIIEFHIYMNKIKDAPSPPAPAAQKSISEKDKQIIYKKYLEVHHTIRIKTIDILNKLKYLFTKKSYIHKIFDNIITIVPIIDEYTKKEVNTLITQRKTGGGGNIIDIKKTYDLYYSTNTEELIIELLDILGTNENVIYFLLIINKSLSNFFKDLNKILIDFYNTDILLSYYYNEKEIIYYIFLNYIYNNYKSLLTLSTKDIIINIGKIKTRENYNDIYKKIDELLKNPEIISKLIIFIKSHLKIPETIKHPKKIKDVEYILLFIYKYSKKDEKIIKGYDSFLTYIYLNILNKFNKTPKIKIDNLPTFNLYNFTNLNKTYYFELSSNQEQLCIKLMKDIKLLISIISERYKYIEHKKDIKSINKFVLNDEILDYINIFGNDEIFKNYNQLSIIDLYILNKNTKIDIKDIKEPTKQDNIIYNILLLSSFLYKDNNNISVEVYCKLVRHYFLIRHNKTLNDLTYEFIYLMNKRISKVDIQRNLIKELSNFNIELSEIKKFVEPEKRDKNIIELLEKINFINYFKNNIELIIPFILEFYKTENKIQYSIQDLLCKQILIDKPLKLLMYGGDGDDIGISSDIVKSQPTVYEKSTELVNNIFSDIRIDELEKINKKINTKISEIKKISDIYNELLTVLKLTITIPDKGDTLFTSYYHYIGEDFEILTRHLIRYCTEEDFKKSPHSPQSMRYKAELNNKLIEITKLHDKIKNVYESKLKSAEDEIKNLYENSYKTLIEKIKNQKEIHDYPYIKEIYKLYIKDDDEKNNLMYDITEYFKDYRDKLKDFVSNIDDIINGTNGKLPNLIKNLDEIIISNKQQQKYKPGGGKRSIMRKEGGGEEEKRKAAEELQAITALQEKLNKRIQDRDKKIDNISKNFKKLKENRKIDGNVEKKLAASNLFDKDGNNIFERLLKTYENDINDKTIPDEIAMNLFYNKVKNNNLDPEIELDITLNDKLVFIAVVYCIRFGSLLFCEYLIKYNKITDINKSLFYYLIFYYVIFGSLLLIINIDTFKLRILVNYMNLHISTTNIWMHIILMGCFVYLIYLLVMNILGDEKPPTELGDHEKIKLKYKLDLLTIIIYVFICILIFII